MDEILKQQKQRRRKSPVPISKVERIFEEAGYDLEFPINWGGISDDPDLQKTLRKTKDCDKTELFDFISENIKIKTDRHIAWGKDPENQEYVKGDEDTFSPKFTNKLRNTLVDIVFEWYDKNVLGIESSEAQSRF